ncbi:MAG: OmpA family protein [Smithella sp.]|jgi:outer membrane protein OmpA-like peptidoglycan-associated protein
MKKIGMLVFIIMMMAVVTAVQAEVRAGGLPALVVDDRISDGNAPATAPARAGALPVITVDERIPDCTCKTDPSCCAKPVVASAPVPEPVPEPAPVVVPPPAPAPKPVIIEKGRQTLNVEFDFDKSTIKKGYYQDIDNLAGVMKQYPDLNLVIEGHTDSIGSDAYNEKLSRERADAVKNYMVEKNGIDANRIKAIGFGEKQPVASNDTSEGRAQNRRVEAAVDYRIEK